MSLKFGHKSVNALHYLWRFVILNNVNVCLCHPKTSRISHLAHKSRPNSLMSMKSWVLIEQHFQMTRPSFLCCSKCHWVQLDPPMGGCYIVGLWRGEGYSDWPCSTTINLSLKHNVIFTLDFILLNNHAKCVPCHCEGLLHGSSLPALLSNVIRYPQMSM